MTQKKKNTIVEKNQREKTQINLPENIRIKRLFEAIEKGDYEQYQQLLVPKKDINKAYSYYKNQNYFNVTFLFWAVTYKQLKITLDLLGNHKANPNTPHIFEKKVSTEFFNTLFFSHDDST